MTIKGGQWLSGRFFSVKAEGFAAIEIFNNGTRQ
jgi:hypothetical protein